MKSQNQLFLTFTKEFLKKTAIVSGATLLGLPWLIYVFLESNLLVGALLLIASLFGVAFFVSKDFLEKETKEYKDNFEIMKRSYQKAEDKQKIWRKSLTERAKGFPTLFTEIEHYEELVDNSLSEYLVNKSHPARSAADVVRAESKKRREALFLQRKTQSIIEYYENIAPFLLEFKEQEFDEDDSDLMRDFTEEEKLDPASNFLTKEEYRKLSSVERNSMALERYWKRPKSKWLIGRIYERYVGYLFESQGYKVDYAGIFKGYEDLGRDLICTKTNEIVIIQCKNWSKFKTIFEKHIFQFFGTVFQYRDQNKGKKVRAIFYTTTTLSELARRFAKELNIELEESFKMSNSYPCIKCNISKVDGSKIYHLPFDQQYDGTKIEPNKGEFYCTSIEEAEKKGFRRAFRWKGKKVL